MTTPFSAAVDAADTFDYVIVGAGTAGCLLANRLSADPRKRVLLLEAGKRDNYHWIHIPVGYLYCIGNPRTDWLYETAPTPGLNGRKLRYPRGKALGGCSSINGMIYMRGQARDYDRWADLTGDADWRWDRCLPDFLAHESHHSQDQASAEANPWHRGDGEWRVEKQRLRWDVLDAFALAAQQKGIPATPDFNRGDNAGVSYFEVNQRKGWRWNTSKAFLNPVKHRSNLVIRTQTQVEKLAIEKSPTEGWRCAGAWVVDGATNRRYAVGARTSVILSAGSIGSVQLLECSGIGDPAVLAQAGVEPLVNLPGVGENLQDHLQIRAVFSVKGVKTLNTMANSWWGKAMIGLEYALKRSGPMSMAPSQLGAFVKSDPSQPHANLQYHVQPLSLDAFGEPLHRFNAFTASVCNLNPTSRGSVHIQSPDSQQPPVIAPNYLSTDIDRKIAADSLRLTREIVSQSALENFQPEEVKPGIQYQTDDELARLAGDIATTIFHPVGTTKMGRDDDPMAVVDTHLRVRDGAGGLITGLRVVDAGVMPTITSGNTNSPTLMIAEKAARWIVENT